MGKNNASNKNPDLAECPVCKGSVSKNAEHCPHCGQPLVGEKIRLIWLNVLCATE